MYCDVIFGNYENGSCIGNEVYVGGDGYVYFYISFGSEDLVIVIYIGIKCYYLKILIIFNCIVWYFFEWWFK